LWGLKRGKKGIFQTKKYVGAGKEGRGKNQETRKNNWEKNNRKPRENWSGKKKN